MKFSEVPIGASFKVRGGNSQWMRASLTQAVSGDRRSGGWGPDVEVELIAERTSTRVRFDELDEYEQFTIAKRPGQVYEYEQPEIAVNVETGKVLRIDDGEMVDTLIERKRNPGLRYDYPIPPAFEHALKTRDGNHLRKAAKKVVGTTRHSLCLLVADLIDRITELENSRQRQAEEHLADLKNFNADLQQLSERIDQMTKGLSK